MFQNVCSMSPGKMILFTRLMESLNEHHENNAEEEGGEDVKMSLEDDIAFLEEIKQEIEKTKKRIGDGTVKTTATEKKEEEEEEEENESQLTIVIGDYEEEEEEEEENTTQAKPSSKDQNGGCSPKTPSNPPSPSTTPPPKTTPDRRRSATPIPGIRYPAQGGRPRIYHPVPTPTDIGLGLDDSMNPMLKQVCVILFYLCIEIKFCNYKVINT